MTIVATVGLAGAAVGLFLATADASLDRMMGVVHDPTAEEIPELLALCGITGPAFAHPDRATGSGWQEQEWTFSYDDVGAEWVDHNVFVRFGVEGSITELQPGDATDLSIGNTSYPIAPGTVYASPFARSEMGTTRFYIVAADTPGHYDADVACANTAGINGTKSVGAVSTSTVP